MFQNQWRPIQDFQGSIILKKQLPVSLQALPKVRQKFVSDIEFVIVEKEIVEAPKAAESPSLASVMPENPKGVDKAITEIEVKAD
jgi:hypothetical protein